MALYRLRHRYRSKADRVFEAVDDAEALTRARTLANGLDWALRRGERCVALIRHDAAPLLVAGSLGCSR